MEDENASCESSCLDELETVPQMRVLKKRIFAAAALAQTIEDCRFLKQEAGAFLHREGRNDETLNDELVWRRRAV